MKECISIKTDYEILSSMIKVPELISYAKNEDIKTLGIIDSNLSGSIEFIKLCLDNDIKPLVALHTIFNYGDIYLYAKNETGLKSLFKINTYIQENDLDINFLKKYIDNIIIVIPYSSINIYDSLKSLTRDIFLGYQNEDEESRLSKISSNLVYFNISLSLNKENTKYINYLNMIKDNLSEDEYTFLDYSNNYLICCNQDFFTKNINITLSKSSNLIPHFDDKIKDSYKYLEDLSIKGLIKRLNGNVPTIYKQRLLYELKVIKDMNFVDYFLIVFDYVKYSIKNDILVGPGRGSAAGSLVTYSLGITNVDPIKYNLLFERFLNPERVTMPDIDIDFDSDDRYKVIDYVRSRYGLKRVMPIMTYGTLASKQALLSVSRILNVDISSLNKHIDSKKSLKENLTKEVVKIINSNSDIKKVYYDAMKVEGLKKHISTHAAGIVISSKDLDEVIPIIKDGDTYLTGYTMNYLEELGLLKMDFLAIKDLSTIKSILISSNTSENLNKIDLNDRDVYARFKLGDTTGIFQFESSGMKSFLRKLKPNNFNDLVIALALFRPGPMQNIDTFINRRLGRERVEYIHPSLEDILNDTYGIIVYQEQIMEIFRRVASYSLAEADLVRRAISKKKEDILLHEKEKFVKRGLRNGYDDTTLNDIYELILKFASYGFNKSHSVAYALVGYQMMYLKVKYPAHFYTSLLSINTGSSSKTKEYLDEAKTFGLKISKPDINLSTTSYVVKDSIIMPITLIKNIGIIQASDIINERCNGKYLDYFDFIKRIFKSSVNQKTITNLIYAGALDSFNETRRTLIENLNDAFIYAELSSGLESNLVSIPNLNRFDEYPTNILMEKELELYGFYVSNHPVSTYKCPKINSIKEYFDKNIEVFVLVENIKKIKTKKGDNMAFVSISDETGRIDATVFPNSISLLDGIKVGDIIHIFGHVEKRMDKYQIIINKIMLVN